MKTPRKGTSSLQEALKDDFNHTSKLIQSAHNELSLFNEELHEYTQQVYNLRLQLHEKSLAVTGLSKELE